jgi:hypothetical protein
MTRCIGRKSPRNAEEKSSIGRPRPLHADLGGETRKGADRSPDQRGPLTPEIEGEVALLVGSLHHPPGHIVIARAPQRIRKPKPGPKIKRVIVAGEPVTKPDALIVGRKVAAEPQRCVMTPSGGSGAPAA